MKYLKTILKENKLTMKLKPSLFFLCMSFMSFTYSQNITFDQVQNLRKESIDEVEIFLTQRGWKMTDASNETSDKLGSATFGYNIDMFDSEKANSWITFYENSNNAIKNRISIQITQAKIYSAFLARLSANLYKMKSSQIEDGRIIKVYQSKSTTCVVKTFTSEGVYSKSTAYSFFFIDNLSYTLNYESESSQEEVD